ncbi:MAG TPA: vWA domain-containing protein [Polyangiaceae bacterium]|jgi:hypothetical protein|nr:vWA domain-containing protein [Polyangiaceae bacterium]
MRFSFSIVGCLAAWFAVSGCSSDSDEGGKGSTVTGSLQGQDGRGPTPRDPDEGDPRGGPGGATDLTGLIDGEPQLPECSDQFAPAAARPPLIQFVVDTSGSMNWVAGTQSAPRAGEQSKWQITQQALATAINAMPDDVAVGVSYFPNVRDGDPRSQCFRPEEAAPLAPLGAAQRALIQQVNDAAAPFGGTPTHGAYRFGIEQLRASPLEGPRFLLLITDGIPTYTLECQGDGRTRVDGKPLVADVKADYDSSQIRTFVIGSPGSEDARDELSQMASVGGTASPGCDVAGPSFCHFDMTAEPDFSKALNAALAEITQSTLACDYALPKPPGGLRLDFNDASVVLESGGSSLREFERATSSDCASGWEYGADRSSLHLCPSTCSELQGLLRQDPNLDVRIKFGCSTTPR